MWQVLSLYKIEQYSYLTLSFELPVMTLDTRTLLGIILVASWGHSQGAGCWYYAKYCPCAFSCSAYKQNKGSHYVKIDYFYNTTYNNLTGVSELYV